MKKYLTKMTLKALASKESLKTNLLNENGFTHISEVGGISIAAIGLVILVAAAVNKYTDGTFLPNMWAKLNGMF